MMIIFLFILSFFLADVAESATYWVSPSGNDGAQHCFNSATLPSSLTTTTSRTITQGTNCLNGGDTLNILAGTYNENVLAHIDAFQKVPNGSAPSNYTTVQAYCPSGVCTTPDGSYGPASGAQSVTVNGQFHLYGLNYVQLKNIKVNNVGDGIYLSGGGAHHLKADGVDVTGTGCSHALWLANIEKTGTGSCESSSAIALGPNATDIWVTHARIHDSRAGDVEGHSHCWYTEADRALIEWSTCFNWSIGAAVHQYVDGSTQYVDSIFRNLLLYNFPGNTPMVLWDGLRTTAYNIIVYNSQAGIVFNNCSNCSLYNSTFVGNLEPSVPVVEVNGSTTTVRNTIISGNASGQAPFGGPGSPTTSNNLCDVAATGCSTTAPLKTEPSTTTFVNYATRDLHLKAGSVAINGGTSTGCPATDLTGTPRGTPCDVGAYKYIAPVVGPPPVDQLVVALPLDEGTGSIAVDISGQKNNAALVGGATWDNGGRFGKAVMLDGTGYLNVPASSSLALAPGMTLESWIFPTVTPTGFTTVIAQERYFLYASSDPGYCSAAVGAPIGGYTTAADNFICATSLPPPNDWSHLAVTYNGATIIFYLNGIVVASQNSADPMVPASANLTIGASQFGENFIGRIDQPMVYNYPRTQQQIVSDMNTSLIAPPGKYVEIAAPTSVEISAASTLEIAAD